MKYISKLAFLFFGGLVVTTAFPQYPAAADSPPPAYGLPSGNAGSSSGAGAGSTPSGGYGAPTGNVGSSSGGPGGSSGGFSGNSGNAASSGGGSTPGGSYGAPSGNVGSSSGGPGGSSGGFGGNTGNAASSATGSTPGGSYGAPSGNGGSSSGGPAGGSSGGFGGNSGNAASSGAGSAPGGNYGIPSGNGGSSSGAPGGSSGGFGGNSGNAAPSGAGSAPGGSYGLPSGNADSSFGGPGGFGAHSGNSASSGNFGGSSSGNLQIECKSTETAPGSGSYKFTCEGVDPNAISVKSEHVLWLETPAGQGQVLDIEIPNYKIEELIKAGFKPVEGKGSTINLLLKKPEQTYDAQVDVPKVQAVKPAVKLQYEPVEKKLVHFPNDKPYSPLQGPILPPPAGGRPQRQVINRQYSTRYITRGV